MRVDPCSKAFFASLWLDACGATLPQEGGAASVSDLIVMTSKTGAVVGTKTEHTGLVSSQTDRSDAPPSRLN